MHRDSIVDEVHAVREELLDEFGGNTDALIDDMNRRLLNGEYGDRKVVSFPPKAPRTMPKRALG